MDDKRETDSRVLADDVEAAEHALGLFSPLVEPAYIRHPPRYWNEGDNLSLVAPQHELLPLLVYARDLVWTSTKNPVFAVESIIQRHREGLFPSVALMGWLVDGLEKWHQEQGKKSLEQCLGLKKPKGHASNMMKEAHRIRLWASFMIEMQDLRWVFGVTVEQAAEMVAARLAEPGWSESHHDIKAPDGNTLKDRYRKSSWVKYEFGLKISMDRFRSEDAKRDFLAKYPRHAWQHLPQLKAFL